MCRDDNKINVLSVQSLEVERVIGTSDESDSEDIIYTFALDPDEKLLVTANRSGLLKVWDFESGELRKTWKSIHQGPISCIEFQETTKILATAGSDSSIRLWDFQNQICKGTLRGVQGVFSVIKFHPKQSLNVILGAADDSNIVAWDYEVRKAIKTFQGHISRITSISFAEDENTFISSSRDKVMILWNFKENCQIRTIPVYESVEASLVLPYSLSLPTGVELSDKSKIYVASAGEEGIVKIWQSNESKLIFKQSNSLVSKSSEDGGLAITQMLFNQKLQQIAVVSADHNIIVHDLQTFKCQKQLIGFTDEILDLLLVGNKKKQFLVMATNSNDIKIYDTETMNSKILKGHNDIVLSLAGYKNILLSSGKDNSVRMWTIDFDNFEVTLRGIGVKHTSAVGSIDFSKVDGNFFVSASEDQCLKLWKVPTKLDNSEIITLSCINTTLAHEKDINCVTISPNDRFVATSSQDKTVKLWESSSLGLLGVFRGHKRGVWSVRFSPVDQIIVTCAADCTIRLWNLSDYSCLKSFESHDASVLRVEFLSNGMQLISAGGDGLLKLWNIKTSECIQTLEKHEARVWTIAVNPDESSFYTGGSDSLLIKWKDVTETKKLEETQKKWNEILQEQEMNNLLNQKKVLKALKLALNLDRPHMTLKIINTVIKNQESGLEDTICSLNNDHKQSLLNHAVSWNTNSRNCRPAQLVLHILLQETLNGDFSAPGLGKMIEETMPYTERHYKRMTEYLKDLKFVEYTMKRMQPYGDVEMKSGI